jgi:hypothetical protein
MTISLKIGIGAAITFSGLLILGYVLPIISAASASNGPVFSESDVPKYPDAAKGYIPMAIGGIGLLPVGISFLAVGLNESIPQPAMRNDLTKTNESLDRSRDIDSTVSEAA